MEPGPAASSPPRSPELGSPAPGQAKCRPCQMSSNNDNVVISMSQRNSDSHSGTTSSDLTAFPTEGPVLSFHSIHYIKMKNGFLFSQKTFEEKALSNINGIMKPGLNAIMGPLREDRSLLLDVLAARKYPPGLSGDVWVHEIPHADNFQCISGYVEQDDVIMSTLTVRENLQFSAALRLPTTMTNQDKKERVNMVIGDLGLDEVADSMVVSKGDIKRTSIGMELIHDPSILFLDEPTTGLDWETANDVFIILQRISEQARIIIFSTHHHPLYSIFKLFDSLTLLASGELMYHGPAQDALEHFKVAGYHYEPYYSPVEFFLGVINGVIERQSKDYEDKTEVTSRTEESVIKVLAECYGNSGIYKDTKTKLDQLSTDQNKRSLIRKEIPYVTSFGHQLIGITRCSFQNLVGHPHPWIAQMLAKFILGLVVGVTFHGLRNGCTDIQNRAGVLFFLMAHQCFSSVSALELFTVLKKLFIHKYISGYYRVLPYLLGTLLSDLIPKRFLPSFVFTCTLYFMVGSKPAADTFFIMLLTLTVVAFTSFSLALALEATRVVNIYFVCMMILSGLSLYLGTMMPQLSWLQYFSIPYYGFTALQHNEFLGRNFCPSLNITFSINCPNYVICHGEEFLIMQNINLSPWGLWKNHMALGSLMIIFLIITYLKLLFLRKYS